MLKCFTACLSRFLHHNFISRKRRQFHLTHPVPIGVPDTFQFSRGWLHRFKQRHGIRQHTSHGEAASVDEAAVESGKEALCRTLRNFDRNDTYNMDETSLFYKLGPCSTLSTQAVPGTKKSKERITVALICNASGSDKRKPVVIAKSRRPRCFGKTFDPTMYCDYYHNKKAWMTTAVFQTIVKKLDRDLRLSHRRGVLVLDNATCHNVTGLELTNLELCFLPKNTTSHLQPLDAGIIRSFKSAYRRDLVSLFIERVEQGEEMTVNLLEAIRMVHRAWKSVPEATVVNCWGHTGILEATSADNPLDDENLTLAELRCVMQRLTATVVDDAAVYDYLQVDGYDTCAAMTDDDIIEVVDCDNVQQGGSDDDSEEEGPVVSVEEARSALRTALAFFEQRNNGCQVHAITRSLQELSAYSNMKQLSLDGFMCNPE